jgi:hypothetical protein
MPRPVQKRTSPQLATRAAFVPASVNEELRTVDIIWTTGAEGERCEWDGEVYLESLRVDDASVRMGRLNAGAPLLNAHQQWNGLSDQIGVVERAWIEDGIGHATVKFSSRPEVEPFWRDVIGGVIRNISVGYIVYRYEVIESTSDGEPKRMVAVDWEPMELSFVPVPFDMGAQVRGGASPRTFTAEVINRSKGSKKMRTIKAIRAALVSARAAVLKAREVADEAKAVEAQAALEEIEAELEEALDELDEGLGAADPAPADPAPAPAPTSAAADDAAVEERGRVAERTRQAGIRALATRFTAVTPADIDGLIARGATLEQAQISILTTLQERQAVINPHGGAQQVDHTKTRTAMELAILNRAAPAKHKATDDIRQFRGYTLFDMARRCVEMAGGKTEGLSRRELAMISLNIGDSRTQRAAGMHSTSDFPLILGNTIDRALRASYDETAQTWQPLGQQRNVNDFRTRTTVALGDAAAFEKVLEGGEYKYGSLPEEGSTLQVAKYGKIIAFTWEALINDDLGAFDRVPAALAQAARQTESNIVWGLILGNPLWIDGFAIYSTQHGNIAGSGGPINVATLAAARAAMRKQKGINGTNYINIVPKYLVVGPDKELEAYQYTSANYVPVTNGTINPVQNTTLQVIVEPRIVGNEWYLVGDGADTFEYAYLEGENGMFTETREGFEVDGLEVKARLVFGAAFVDYRSMYKNPGA